MFTCANAVKQLVCMCQLLKFWLVSYEIHITMNSVEVKSAAFPSFAAFGQTPELRRRRYTTELSDSSPKLVCLKS